ncbi:MAG: alanine racemase [Acidimicrobiia bacterium]|nr:alanine racemase [Acidimicrobiia bacterium]
MGGKPPRFPHEAQAPGADRPPAAGGHRQGPETSTGQKTRRGLGRIMIDKVLSSIPTPALVVDRAVLEHNIADMARRMRDLGVALRPHWKTSKMVEVARLQDQAGCVGFTCATPAEVECLLDHGYTDLTWAHQPVGPSKVAFAVEANRRGTVRVALDSLQAASPLSGAAVDAQVAVPYLIEVDTGLGRAGVTPAQALELAGRIASLAGLEFEGIITHAGHLSRFGDDRSSLEAEGRAVGTTMVGVARALREAGHQVRVVSVGSTPGSTSTPAVAGITEARPGTYVFNDANQVTLGSTDLTGCALTVAARVVSTPRPGEAIIDAGSKSMSSDGPTSGVGFGRVLAGAGGYADLHFFKANEEHGFLKGPGVMTLRVGDMVRIVPNHACTTVNMWSRALVIGQQGDIEEWKIRARR